jgi:ribosome-binding protein aMBF1 (putative translation factor)
MMKRNPDLPQSGVPGVRWSKDAKKWVVAYVCGGEYHHVGYFTDLDIAIAAKRREERKNPESVKHGLSYRRYPAPPGYRACCDPDCTSGPNGTRFIAPEDQFPKQGKYRIGRCRTCKNLQNRMQAKRLYQSSEKRRQNVAARTKKYRGYAKKQRNGNREWRIKMAAKMVDNLNAQGLTHVEISARCGVNHETISMWKNGRVVPQEGTFRKLADMVIELNGSLRGILPS